MGGIIDANIKLTKERKNRIKKEIERIKRFYQN